MAKELLKARQVHVAPIGDLYDGDGLILRVRDNGARWVFRYTSASGKRRELGLGKAHRSSQAAAGTSLTDARAAADKARTKLRDGIDPVDDRARERDEAKQAEVARKVEKQRERLTLLRYARQYHERVIEPQRTRKHAAQWIASVEQGVPLDLLERPIDEVDTHELLNALGKLQLRVPETARRVRQRLETLFDDAIFNRLCRENPARIIKRKLAELPKGRDKGAFAALAYADVPSFVAALRNQEGLAARALEFALLCAARTGEVLGCQWSEIDEAAAIWRVPASRMKGKQEHVVFLSPRAIEIVKQMREVQGDPYVFPSPVDRRRPMSNMAMLTLLRRMGVSDSTTVHGLCRASFSTWANEQSIARPDVIEVCLAHREADKVRASYNRSAFNAERRALLLAWSKFLNGENVGAVKPEPEVASAG